MIVEKGGAWENADKVHALATTIAAMIMNADITTEDEVNLLAMLVGSFVSSNVEEGSKKHFIKDFCKVTYERMVEVEKHLQKKGH